MKKYLVTLVLMVMCWHTGLCAMDFWDPYKVAPSIEREKPQESLEELRERYQIMAILHSHDHVIERKTEKPTEKWQQAKIEQPKSIWTQLEESARRTQWGTLYSGPTKAQQQREAERARSLQESIERYNKMQARLALYTHDFAEEAEKLIARRRREESEKKCGSQQLMTPSEVFKKIQISARKIVRKEQEEREAENKRIQQLRQKKEELEKLRNQSREVIKKAELSKKTDRQAVKEQHKKYADQQIRYNNYHCVRKQHNAHVNQPPSNNYAIKNKRY